MLEQIITSLAGFIVAVISAGGYAGVALLMTIESACIPLPSEIIMPFAGYLASTGRFSLIGAATMGALGCNIGSTIAYYVAAYGGRSVIERWGPYVLIRPADLHHAERFFARYGGATVFIGRLLPVVRTFIAFPAGLARMPMLRFQIYTFVGSWPWCFALAYVGYVLGDHWNNSPTLRSVFHSFDLAIVVALLAAIAWFLWSHWPRRQKPMENGKKQPLDVE
jgi:membrane protein DedA with SNARE-associated domain